MRLCVGLLVQRMLNAAKAEAEKDKTCEPKKPQNPEALRAQENKVTHDKVRRERFHPTTVLFDPASSFSRINQLAKIKIALYRCSLWRNSSERIDECSTAINNAYSSPISKPKRWGLVTQRRNKNDNSVTRAYYSLFLTRKTSLTRIPWDTT